MKQFNDYYYNLTQTQKFTSQLKSLFLFYAMMIYSLGMMSTVSYNLGMFEISSSFNLCLALCLCMIGYIKEKLEKNIKI